MLTSARRLVSAGLAIVLGVSFVTSTLVLTSSLDASVQRATGGAVRDAAVVVSPGQDATADIILPEGLVVELAALPGVERVRPVAEHPAVQQLGSRTADVVLMTPPELSSETRLISGRLPEAVDEIALNRVLADLRQAQPGDRLTFQVRPPQPDPAGSESPAPPERVEVTVVGVLEAGIDSTSRVTLPIAFAAAPHLARISGYSGYTALYVHASGDPETLATTVRDLPGVRASGAVVRTGADELRARFKDNTRGSEQFTVMLLAFGVVALLVAGLVITNTFSILIAQRTRQLALMRTIGATRRQVFRLVLAEAVLLGLAASAVGVILGFGLVAAALPALGAMMRDALHTFAATPRDVVVPLLAGMLVTAGAVLVPARRATRVPPLAALRPYLAASLTTDGRVRPSGWAIVPSAVGVALLTAGWALSVFTESSTEQGVLVGIGGGALSVLGMLGLTGWLAPIIASWLGHPLRRLGGVPAELGAENAVRNPRRAAATVGALLVGVTLVTMMTVGAACGQASIQADLDQQYPMDAVIAGQGGSLTDAQLELARAQDRVAATAVRWQGLVASDDPDVQWLVSGYEPDTEAVLHDPHRLAGLADGVLLVGTRTKLGDAPEPVVDGSTVTLRGERTMTFTVRITPHATQMVALTASDLRALDPDATRQLMVRFSPGADPVAASDSLAEALSTDEPVEVTSAAGIRADTQRTIDTILLVVVSVLGVAVIIALVGIGNTLALSVHERRQESGLLRAMGLTRAQLRACLGWEALLLAAIAVLWGLVLGMGYGLIGTATLLGGRTTLVWVIPWERLALIAAVALGAGWLASVLPARRASRVAPAAALALGE